MEEKYCLALGFWKGEILKKICDQNNVSSIIIPDSNKLINLYADIISIAENLKIKIIYNKFGQLLKFDEANADILYSSGYPYIFETYFLKQFRVAINCHPLDLPEFPGRYMVHALTSGRETLNITIHHMDAGVDTGPILAKYQYQITDFTTPRGVLKLSTRCEINHWSEIEKIIEGCRSSIDYEMNKKTNEPKRTPDDSEIDSRTSLQEALLMVRLCDVNLYPAFFMHKGRKVLIKFESHPAMNDDEI